MNREVSRLYGSTRSEMQRTLWMEWMEKLSTVARCEWQKRNTEDRRISMIRGVEVAVVVADMEVDGAATIEVHATTGDHHHVVVPDPDPDLLAGAEVRAAAGHDPHHGTTVDLVHHNNSSHRPEVFHGAAAGAAQNQLLDRHRGEWR